VTVARPETETTRLGRAIGPKPAAHPGKSGIYGLPDARAAFAARAILAGSADRTLDVQYYIWHGDETGYLLLETLWDAAQRGVKVRLLLDDNNTAGLDPTITALDAHSNIEVRLYNPLFHRRARLLNYVTDFTRLNRRMHNKSFTADNQVTIVGGRNVGNEYFGLGAGVGFRDLDVIAVGPVVDEVASAFDRYWWSPSAYPAQTLLGRVGPDPETLRARFEQVRARPAAKAYLASLADTTLVRGLIHGDLSLEWATARLLVDDPAKTLDTTGNRNIMLLSALMPAIGTPESSFDLISPYLVPGAEGTAALAAIACHGASVRILTNSLAATDVTAVHAGYARRRVDLLRSGIRLYELKPSALRRDPEGRGGYGGSSSASLHAKTFVVDRRLVFVGSFNFDERSALLNTEMGLLIESPALADYLVTAFEVGLPEAAYEVRLGDHRELEWIERQGTAQSRYTTEPGTSGWRRATVSLLSHLPIEWLL
jgi:putative cardiolipin synthase